MTILLRFYNSICSLCMIVTEHYLFIFGIYIFYFGLNGLAA